VRVRRPARRRARTDIQRLFAEAKRAFGRVDILVNNAGVFEFAPIEQVTAEHFHRQFDRGGPASSTRTLSPDCHCQSTP
jgi:NAD(P)-dependent dehydrogenase (short-subunit alcohol dehydrogenase family)